MPYAGVGEVRALGSITAYSIYTVDADGVVQDWYAGAECQQLYAAADIVGRRYDCLYTEEDRQAGVPERALRIAAETGKFIEDGWRLRQDGSRFLASVVIEPIAAAQGAGTAIEAGGAGFIVVSRDIDDRRAREQAVERQYSTQKSEALGKLTGGFAHEFNNSLTAIGGSLDLVRAYSQDERVRRITEIAHISVDRAKKLISQLLSFSGGQVLRPEVSDLNQLISVFRDLLLRAGGDRIDLTVEAEPQLGAVLLDKAQLQSALINLVQNAREAMPGGGVLTIRTYNTLIDEARAARLHDLRPGPYVVLEIGDTGTGMAQTVRDSAAEPFFTTRQSRQASGLGLSQVLGFVRQSGGEVEIDSVPNEGTRVRLLLPEHHAAEQPATEGAEPAQLSVLVVEDNEDVLSISREILTSFGYHVYCAEDAVQALKILQNEVPIDVLFTDVVMPNGISGVELAERARALRPDIRVLMASGYMAASLRQSHALDERTPFLAKPYRMTELIKAMTKLA